MRKVNAAAVISPEAERSRPEQLANSALRNSTILNKVCKEGIFTQSHWSATVDYIYILYISSTSVWVSCRPVHWIGGCNEANTKRACFLASAAVLWRATGTYICFVSGTNGINVERRPVWWSPHHYWRHNRSEQGWEASVSSELVGILRPRRDEKIMWATSESM